MDPQANFDLAIPKNIHSFLIGKEGKTVKELMDSTSTIIRIPKSDDPSNLINVSGTAENIRAAIAKIQLMSDEKVWPFLSVCLGILCTKSVIEGGFFVVVVVVVVLPVIPIISISCNKLRLIIDLSDLTSCSSS